MQGAVDIAEFRRDPVGRWVAGRSFFVFCTDDGVWGYVAWGDLGEEDLRAIVEAVEVELTVGAPAHVTFVDPRRVTSVHPSSFAITTAFILSRWDLLRRSVSRVAFLRPDGFLGLLLEGARAALVYPFAAHVARDPQEGLAALEVDDQALIAELAQIQRDLMAGPRVARSLRSLLERHIDDMTVADAAQILGLSTRTLQRRLGEVGTSFQKELNAAQVRVAEKLLLETDTTISRVALDVGCASIQHFNTLFRRVTGETPSRWRARWRPSASRLAPIG